MAEKDFLEFERANVLLDHLGGLLEPSRRETMKLYYAEDWSLSEIAERAGISRQAVHARIKQDLESLEMAEQELGVIARRRKLLEELKTFKEQHPELDEAGQESLQRMEQLALPGEPN